MADEFAIMKRVSVEQWILAGVLHRASLVGGTGRPAVLGRTESIGCAAEREGSFVKRPRTAGCGSLKEGFATEGEGWLGWASFAKNQLADDGAWITGLSALFGWARLHVLIQIP